jgi:hypothetical protein
MRGMKLAMVELSRGKMKIYLIDIMDFFLKQLVSIQLSKFDNYTKKCQFLKHEAKKFRGKQQN